MAVILKTLALVWRFIEFCCSIIILAIYAYFAAVLRRNNLGVDRYTEAVIGMSGVGVLYTIAAFILVCCLGGISFFAILGFLMDILFIGAFIFIAWQSRGGAQSCQNYVNTPLGSGVPNESNFGLGIDDNTNSYDFPSLYTSCRLETATFALAIIAIFFFLISAFTDLATWRSNKSQSKYGPSPSNNYTTGRGKRRFWSTRPRGEAAVVRGAGSDALPVHSTPGEMRTSYATDNTAVGTEAPYNKYNNNATNY